MAPEAGTVPNGFRRVKKFSRRGGCNRIFRIFEGCKAGERSAARRLIRRAVGEEALIGQIPDAQFVMSEMNEPRKEEPVRESAVTEPVDTPAPQPAGSRFPTFGDLLAMLGIAFVAQILVGILGRVVMAAAGYGGGAAAMAPNVVGKMMAVLYFVSMAVTLGGVLYYRRVRGGRGRWARFSIRGLNPMLLLWAFVLIFAVGIVLEPLLRVLPDLSLEVGRGFWTMLSLILFAPVFEELLCRGVVLGSLRERYGVTVAWLVSSLFFGVLHVQPVQVVSATAVGLILGYVYLATDSLWPSMILHALNNAAAYLLMILFVTPGEESSTLLIDLVENRTLYGVIYVVAVLLSALSGWMMVRTLRRMKQSGKNPVEA